VGALDTSNNASRKKFLGSSMAANIPASTSKKPNESQIKQNMKHQKQSLSLLGQQNLRDLNFEDAS